MAELTLQLDQELLQKVNGWAESQGVSVDEAVVSLLRSTLNAAGRAPNSDASHLTAWTQSLVGNSDSDQVDDVTLHQQYLDYLEEKYR